MASAVLAVEFVVLFEAPVALGEEFPVLSEYSAGFLVLEGPVALVFPLEVFEHVVLVPEVSRTETAGGLEAVQLVDLSHSTVGFAALLLAEVWFDGGLSEEFLHWLGGPAA